MSSNEVDSWLNRWPEIATRVKANEALARNLVKAARANVVRAQRALKERDLDAAVIWAEAAVLNGADALMQRDGVRVRGKERAHQARFDYPRLPKAFKRNAGLIDRARALRNVAVYAGGGRLSEGEAKAIVGVCGQTTTEIEALFV